MLHTCVNKIKGYQLINHGTSEYAFRAIPSHKFDYVTTGSGKTMSEALIDCLNMIELQDFDIKILEGQLAFLKDDTKTDAEYYITIYWS